MRLLEIPDINTWISGVTYTHDSSMNIYNYCGFLIYINLLSSIFLSILLIVTFVVPIAEDV